MSNGPTFSVVIPCFNRASRIEAAINSALDQSLPPHEIIVVDDGSTDESASVAESLGPAVRVIRTENRGPSAARNLGIDEAQGDWIAFLDADDVWHPEKMTLQAQALAAFPEVKLVFCDTETWSQGKQQIVSRFLLGGVYESVVSRQGDALLFDRSLFHRLLDRSRIFTSAVLVKRGVGGLRFSEDLRGPEDWALWMDLVRRHPFAAVDRVLVTMHYDGDNLSTDMAKILRSGLTVLEQTLNDPTLLPEEVSAVKEALTKRHIAALYHAVIVGEKAHGLALLRDPRSRSIGLFRRLTYLMYLNLPMAWRRRLADWRLGADAAS